MSHAKCNDKVRPNAQKEVLLDENPARCVPHSINPLYGLKDRLAELPLNLLASIIGTGLAVESHQGTEIELGLLEELDLADVDLCFPLAIRMPSYQTNVI